MAAVNTNTPPAFAIPAGAAEVTDWCDLDIPDDAFRSFTGPRRGVDRTCIGNSPNGPHYVEAAGSQDARGQLFDLAVHAQIDLWSMNRHEHYDATLTPEQARKRGAELRADAATLIRLADAFEAAAGEVERWDWWVAQ